MRKTGSKWSCSVI